jgi:uncharacterized membrane protein
MAAKLTRLSHKIAMQLHLVAESFTIPVLAPGGQSKNFWIHRRIWRLFDAAYINEMRLKHFFTVWWD